MRRRWSLFALACIAAIAAVVFARRGPARVAVDTAPIVRQARFVSTVSASGEIAATRYADIGSAVMGKIVSLPVQEGQRVRAGQILARIDAVQAQSDVSGARAQVAALEADVRAAKEQARAAAGELAAAGARAADVEQQLERKRGLFREGVLAAVEFESAKAAADTARAQVAAAKALVDRAQHDEAAAVGRVEQARAQQTRVGDVLAKTSIESPIDGVVTRLRVREGEMVVVGVQNQAGTTLMTISDLSAIDAELKVAEADVLRLAIGQTASVTLEAVAGKRFAGRVVEIGASALPVAGTGAAAREFKVVVRLAAPDASLRPGLTCDAEIVTTEREQALTVPLQAVVLRTRSGGEADETGVFVVSDGRAKFAPVKAGVIGGLDVEVNGVDAGVPVVVGPYQVLRDLQDGALVKSTPRAR
jgi:HlyD family secretion protein